MARLSREYLNKQKEKYGVDRLWSFSRVNTYTQCVHSYFLGYVKKIRGKDNIYSVLGTQAHDILERLYNGEIAYEDMIREFESKLLEMDLSDYKFSPDPDRDKKMRDKYYECVKHFFRGHVLMGEKVFCEKDIFIKVGDHVFMGYIDAIHKDEDGVTIVTDFKTSTAYSGKKIKENGKQLLLYSLGLIQRGVPMDKVKARWNFLKYVNVSYVQKNGKTKVTKAERDNWVSKIATPLGRNLKDLGYDQDDAQALKEQAMQENTLDCMPQEVQDKYTLEDCYVYIEINEDTIKELEDELISTIEEVLEKEKQDDNAWDRDRIGRGDEFYCNVLCGVSGHCKYYQELMEHKDIFNEEKENEDDELLRILGLD